MICTVLIRQTNCELGNWNELLNHAYCECENSAVKIVQLSFNAYNNASKVFFCICCELVNWTVKFEGNLSLVWLVGCWTWGALSNLLVYNWIFCNFIYLPKFIIFGPVCYFLIQKTKDSKTIDNFLIFFFLTHTLTLATFTWTLFASIRMNSFWLSNPNVVFTWTPNKVIGLMWAFICHKLLIGFNLLTCAHRMNIQFPAVVAYCFKKHTWYLFTSGPN